MNRRSFLRTLGLGAAALVVPDVVVEPRRKIWQVSRLAPVAKGWSYDLASHTYVLDNTTVFTEEQLEDLREAARYVSPTFSQTPIRIEHEFHPQQRVDLEIWDDFVDHKIDMRAAPFAPRPPDQMRYAFSRGRGSVQLVLVDPRHRAAELSQVILGLVESGHITPADARNLASETVRNVTRHYDTLKSRDVLRVADDLNSDKSVVSLPPGIELKILDEVDRWHDSPDDGTELHERLGMTPEQYARWVENG